MRPAVIGGASGDGCGNLSETASELAVGASRGALGDAESCNLTNWEFVAELFRNSKDVAEFRCESCCDLTFKEDVAWFCGAGVLLAAPSTARTGDLVFAVATAAVAVCATSQSVM
jgi:hypothetical protein